MSAIALALPKCNTSSVRGVHFPSAFRQLRSGAEDLPVDDETADTLDGDEKPACFENTILGKELGPVVFEMSYADAISRGVLPPFQVVHYGLSLSSEERGRYDYLSKQIKELRESLESGSRRGLALFAGVVPARRHKTLEPLNSWH